jgi:hypothetical protein
MSRTRCALGQPNQALPLALSKSCRSSSLGPNAPRKERSQEHKYEKDRRD